jgi:hypothetical protein
MQSAQERYAEIKERMDEMKNSLYQKSNQTYLMGRQNKKASQITYEQLQDIKE